jgi:hypothetical protein
LVALISGIVVAATGLLGAVVLVIKARPEARKLKSDGTANLLTAASSAGAELADEVREQRGEISKLWQAQRDQEARITKHLRWDTKVVDTLRELGGEISDPPPLYPEGA